MLRRARRGLAHVSLSRHVSLRHVSALTPPRARRRGKVLALDPGHETATCNLYHTKLETCNFTDAAPHLARVQALVDRQLSEGRTPTVRPFHALGYEVHPARPAPSGPRRPWGGSACSGDAA